MIPKTVRLIFVAAIVVLASLISGEASAAVPCFKNICKGYYFTGDMTGYSWSANRRGIVRPYYASFRRSNRTVVVQVDQVHRDGTFSTRTFDVNRPELAVKSKSLLRVSDLALENRKIQQEKFLD